MREQRILRRSRREEEPLPELPTATAVAEVWVQSVEQTCPRSRLGAAQAKEPDLRLLEQVIAEKELVRAFAGEHDLDVTFARELRQQIHRGRCGAHERRLGMTYDVGKDAGDRSRVDVPNTMLASEPLGDEALIRRLVERRVRE